MSCYAAPVTPLSRPLQPTSWQTHPRMTRHGSRRSSCPFPNLVTRNSLRIVPTEQARPRTLSASSSVAMEHGITRRFRDNRGHGVDLSVTNLCSMQEQDRRHCNQCCPSLVCNRAQVLHRYAASRILPPRSWNRGVQGCTVPRRCAWKGSCSGKSASQVLIQALSDGHAMARTLQISTVSCATTTTPEMRYSS